MSNAKTRELIVYAGSLYEVIKRGSCRLKLKSVKDRKLIIGCSAKSTLLKEPEALNG